MDTHIPDIINEIVRTEQDYVQDLQTLETYFMTPLIFQSIITKEETKLIFCNLESISRIHTQLISELKDETLECVVSVFTRFAPFFKNYSEYCNHHLRSIEEVNRLTSTNRLFASQLSNCVNIDQTKKLDLKDYLIKPIQRICKYPLFFNSLKEKIPKDHSLYSSIVNVHNQLNEVAIFANKTREVSENMGEASKIISKFKGSKLVGLSASNRTFKKECTAKVSIDNGKKRKEHLFLFSDSIFFTNKKSELLRVLPITYHLLITYVRELTWKIEDTKVNTTYFIEQDDLNDAIQWVKSIVEITQQQQNRRKSFTTARERPLNRSKSMLEPQICFDDDDEDRRDTSNNHDGNQTNNTTSGNSKKTSTDPIKTRVTHSKSDTRKSISTDVLLELRDRLNVKK